MKLGRTQYLFIISALAIVFSFQNCSVISGGDHSSGNSSVNPIGIGPNPETVNQLAQQNKSAASMVLQQKCASCHNVTAGNRPTNITNLDAQLASNLITAGEPEVSNFYLVPLDELSVNGYNHPTASGVTFDDLNTIKFWILGANFISDDLTGQITGDFDLTGGGAAQIPANFANVNNLIIQKMCISCHATANGGNKNVSLANLASVRLNANTSQLRMSQIGQASQMPPPPSASVDPLLRDLFARWIAAGMPQ